MARFEGNPIITPVAGHPWESRMVFNAAVYHNDRVHILYRAIGEDGVSRLGYASTWDGLNIDERLSYPVFEPATSYEKNGCEDPRITELDGRCAMTYTAYGDIYQIGITTIPRESISEKRWDWGERLYPFPNVKNKNAVIFPDRVEGRYVMLHRLDPDIYIAYSEDLKEWKCNGLIMSPRRDSWDCLKIGAAGPPIAIDEGWLLVYHGVDLQKNYRLGVAILDKENPEEVVFRSEEPILEPEEPYERQGFVPNVVFSCGSVLMDGQLLIYYGGADTVIAVSTYDMNEIIPDL